MKKINTERSSRYQGIIEKKRRSETANALIAMSSEQPNEVVDKMDTSEPKANEMSTQTDKTVNELRLLEDEVDFLRKENSDLKKKLLQKELNEDAFKDDDEKVLFYTGLPTWKLLLCLYNFVSGFLSQSSRCMLSPFQRLILTLMRMRLNLSGKDLAYRFGGIHEATVSRVFIQMMDILHSRLCPLIHWPEREALLKTMPMDFRKNCPACAVIIDCFEIFIDRASNPLARAQTYSSYKHHNTVKYLIGITPQGSVSFISDGWGGRVSDKHLTEECGLLEKLTPGDVILADRGFDIQESVGLYCARVKIPAFTKGKKQLSGIEVEQTRKIANVRIHVERVIGNIRKKYGILSATQPIDFVVSKGGKTTLDKIVTVSCALNNMCDSVVPFE